MNHKTIITIGREFGSGGRAIGQQVARTLGMAFYDRALIELAAARSGLSPDMVRQAEESATPSLLFKIAVQGYAARMIYTDNLQSAVQIAQSGIVGEIAERGPCVIVGRFTNYILRDRSDCLHVFVYSDLESRVRRAVREYGLANGSAQREVLRQDRARAEACRLFTGEPWGDRPGYHLFLDSGALGVSVCAKAIVQAAQGGSR